MPYRSLPNSDITALKAVRAAVRKRAAVLQAGGTITFDPQVMEEFDLVAPLFIKEMDESGTAESDLATATVEGERAMNRVRQITSHFLQTLQNGIRRNALPREVRPLYGLGLDQENNPDLTNEEEIERWALAAIDGDKKRLAKGSTVQIAFPSAAEVKVELEAWNPLRTAQGEKVEAAAKELGDVQALRPRVFKVIAELWDEIEHSLKRQPAATGRKLAREWGVVYATRPGEVLPPEEGAAPVEGASGATPAGAGENHPVG